MEQDEACPLPQRRAAPLLALIVILLAMGFALVDLWALEAPGRALIPMLHVQIIGAGRLGLFCCVNTVLLFALLSLIRMLRGGYLLAAPLGLATIAWAGLELREVFYAGLLGRLAFGLRDINANLAPIARADGTFEPAYDALCFNLDAPTLALGLGLWRFIAWFQFLLFSFGAVAVLALVAARLTRERPLPGSLPFVASAIVLALAVAGSASPIAGHILPLPLAETLARPWALLVEAYVKEDGLKGLFWTFGCGG